MAKTAAKNYVTAATALLLALVPAAAEAADVGPPVELGHDVVVDAGHGGIDGGTSHGDRLEKHLTLALARDLKAALAERGLRAAVTRTDDYAPSDDNRWLPSRSRHLRDLAQRHLIIRELSPRIVVSVHVNWSPDPSRSGPVVLYPFDPQSHALAHLVQERLNRLYGTREVPYIAPNFYLFRRATCPTVILEAGFIGNAGDVERLTTPEKRKKIAAAVADGILAFLLAYELPLRTPVTDAVFPE